MYKFYCGFGDWYMAVISQCQFSFWKVLFHFQKKEIFRHFGQAVIRDKCNPKTDVGKVDEQVVAA